MSSTVVTGTESSDQLFGGGRSDTMTGNGGNDWLFGSGGSDVVAGGAGNDMLFGDASRGGIADMTKLKMAEDVAAKVTFQGESANFKSAIGVYKIAADGTIYDVQILWANASATDSGGKLTTGASSEDLSVAAGERLGFFIVPDAYSKPSMPRLLDERNKGTWAFVDADGNPGNVNAGAELKLVHLNQNAIPTDIKSAYGTSVFHSIDDGSKGLNGDGASHVQATIDTATGTLRIGFEDQKGGGDKDFNDAVFTVEIGTTNAALAAKVATKPPTENHDDMNGGDGDDTLFGMSGNDTLHGGAGDDKLWGNSGDDHLYGDDGRDQLFGGAGNDQLHGDAGDDTLSGNTGDDALFGGAGSDHLLGDAGNDTLHGGAGFDTLEGGSGDDVFLAEADGDTIDGNSGFDTVDFSLATGGVSVDLSKHTATLIGGTGAVDTLSGIESIVGSTHDDMLKGSKADDHLNGGDGNDVLRGLGGSDALTGGGGKDIFQWLAKDVVDDGGNALGVDVITDFSKDDVLDFSKMFKSGTYASVDDIVKVVDDGRSSHVFAAINGDWHEVVTLDGVTGLTASSMVDHGMLLV